MTFIKHIILHTIANMAALYITVQLLAGDFIIIGEIRGYFIAAILFGFLNAFVKPVIKILSLPFVFITAGLFTLVINMFIVWFAKYALDVLRFEGVAVEITGNWVTYLYVGLTMAVVNMVMHWLVKN